ncbi:MAG: hypothetical protein WCV85_03040 [Patescibacteria group bacterium]|jgi:antitoxin component of MazEF toxin-antitoxin module
MTQKVLKVGDSAAVTISKESLKNLGWKVGSRVNVTVDPLKQIVKIVPEKRQNADEDKIAKLTMRFIERYRSDLLALAKQ